MEVATLSPIVPEKELAEFNCTNPFALTVKSVLSYRDIPITAAQPPVSVPAVAKPILF